MKICQATHHLPHRSPVCGGAEQATRRLIQGQARHRAHALCDEDSVARRSLEIYTRVLAEGCPPGENRVDSAGCQRP